MNGPSTTDRPAGNKNPQVVSAYVCVLTLCSAHPELTAKPSVLSAVRQNKGAGKKGNKKGKKKKKERK